MAIASTLRPLFVTLAVLAALPSWAIAPDELFRQVSPSVWQVGVFDDREKPIGTGSAVVIAPQTLVTNCHVLKGAAKVVVRQRDTLHAARLQHADTERDLCQITAASLKAPAVAIAPAPARIGQRIYTIGAPRGLELTLSDGLVSGIREEGGSGGLIQISAPISPGSSGGGLFDDEGRLLGITSSGIVGVAQNLNFARPASLIAEIPARSTAALQRWREAKATMPAAPATAAPALSPVPPVPPAPTTPAPDRKRAPVATRPPADAVSQSQPAPAGPRHIASGYAAIDDLDAIPYLSDRGRAGYREWLGKGTPRAFALSNDGHWASTWGLKPADPDAPIDPAERALRNCERSAQQPCRLYAVNNAVVWTAQRPAVPREASAR